MASSGSARSSVWVPSRGSVASTRESSLERSGELRGDVLRGSAESVDSGQLEVEVASASYAHRPTRGGAAAASSPAPSPGLACGTDGRQPCVLHVQLLPYEYRPGGRQLAARAFILRLPYKVRIESLDGTVLLDQTGSADGMDGDVFLARNNQGSLVSRYARRAHSATGMECSMPGRCSGTGSLLRSIPCRN